MQFTTFSLFALFGASTLASPLWRRQSQIILSNACENTVQYRFEASDFVGDDVLLAPGANVTTSIFTGRTGNIYKFDVENGIYERSSNFAFNVDAGTIFYDVDNVMLPFPIAAGDLDPNGGDAKCPYVQCPDGPDCGMTRTCTQDRVIVVTACGAAGTQ